MKISRAQVEVRFLRKGERFYFQVRLFSLKKGMVGVALYSHLDVVFSANMEQIMHQAGGALAEHQNKLYGDRHDPAEVARAAWEAYQELKVELTSKQPEEIDVRFKFRPSDFLAS